MSIRSRIARLEESRPEFAPEIVVVANQAAVARFMAEQTHNGRPVLCVVTNVPRPRRWIDEQLHS